MDKKCSYLINTLPLDFDQFRAVTLLFIEGLLANSTSHNDILDDESNIIKEQLSQLNRLDCVTTSSQSYENFFVDGQNFRSRPFVYFYYPARKINKLAKNFISGNRNAIMSYYSPKEDKVFMYNEDLYNDLTEERGYFPLHQEYRNNRWIEDYDTSFNPIHMSEEFFSLQSVNKDFFTFAKNNMVLVVVIGLDFTNETFSDLAISAHSLFFE